MRTRPTFSVVTYAGVVEHLDVPLHAGEGHVEGFSEFGDGRFASAEPFDDAAPGGVCDGGEGGVEAS